MEPELFSLARRLWMAAVKYVDPERHARYDGIPNAFAIMLRADEQRTWLAVAVEASPQLAEGLSVPAGHWAAGVLPTSTAVPP